MLRPPDVPTVLVLWLIMWLFNLLSGPTPKQKNIANGLALILLAVWLIWTYVPR